MKTFKCSKSLSNINKNIFTILGRPLTFFTPPKNPKKSLNCPVLSIAHLLLRSLLQFMRDARCLGILHLGPRLSENCGSVVSWARYPTELPYYAIVEPCWTLLNGENDWKLWNLGGQWRSHILRYTNIYGIQREFAAGYHFMKRCSDRRLPDWQVDCCNVNMGFAL